MKLSLVLNHRCNLRCSYCYAGDKVDRPMPPELARRGVLLGLDQADEELVVTFFGGEPLIELERMQSITAFARAEGARRDKRVGFLVSTNATLLDDRALDLFRQPGFSVQVSVDGVPDAQDENRPFADGRASSERVEANIRRLLAVVPAAHAVAVVDPSTVRRLGEGFDHLADLGFGRVSLAPNYLAAWDDDSCEAFETAARDLADRWAARLRGGQDVRLDPFASKVMGHVARGSGHVRRICGFGRSSIAVTPTGELYPCERLVRPEGDPTVCIGDVERGVDTERRDALWTAKQTVDAECAECELRDRCTHWCGCANYETSGDPGRVTPLVCWFERTFIAEADRVASALFTERNPAFVRRFYACFDPPR